MTKFKKGDILIQYAKGRDYTDILKVVATDKGRYSIQFLDGDVISLSYNYIENGSPEWHLARYLTDEEKVEQL